MPDAQLPGLVPIAGAAFVLVYLACIALIYVMLTVSLQVTNGLTGLFSLGHPAFMAIGGYGEFALGKRRVRGEGQPASHFGDAKAAGTKDACRSARDRGSQGGRGEAGASRSTGNSDTHELSRDGGERRVPQVAGRVQDPVGKPPRARHGHADIGQHAGQSTGELRVRGRGEHEQRARQQAAETGQEGRGHAVLAYRWRPHPP